MKLLYLVRHAKSFWENEWLDDFERPLNRRGKRDAPVMADRLRELGVRPDRVLSSPAARAASTARILAPVLGYAREQVLYLENLYDASSSDLLRVISGHADDAHSLMIVAHNPGITLLANRLGRAHIENVPTAGAVALEVDIPRWDTIADGCAETVFFEYPKKSPERA